MKKEYKDVNGTPISLDMLCTREPAWAANRIRHLEDTVEKAIKVGYNKDCLLCGFKDKALKKA